MKRMNKEKGVGDSVEKVIVDNQYEVIGIVFPARKTWYIDRTWNNLNINKSIRTLGIIETIFHIEQLSRNWYKDFERYVKKYFSKE